jgi:S-phase kinase-associated protein 1
MPRFETSDQKTFEINKELIKYSSTMMNVVDDVDEEIENQNIPLRNVNSGEFERIIIYLNHLQELESQGVNIWKKKKPGKKVNLTEWDKNFLNLSKEELFQLYTVANFLSIEQLLDICAKYIAEHISGKLVDYIREYFGEPDDLTPEEKEKIKEENKWINDVQQ